MINTFSHSGTKDTAITERERRNREISRRAAAESIALLKNEGLLPFTANMRLALFGAGARHTIKGGTGSGDVNERNAVTIEEGLIRAGFSIVSTDWLSDYDARYQKARLDWRDLILGDGSEEAMAHFFENYTTHPFFMPDGRPLCEEDLAGADAAVYVVSRIAGEGADRTLEPGDYYLTAQESADLQYLNAHGLPTVLVVNAGGPVQIAETAALPCVRAVLFIAQPGQEGGNALADTLSGKVCPSGKLTSTWARSFEDCPNAGTFSHLSGDTSKELYSEDIYVGYRYFDTFGVKPLYGFGYGLSYTSFEISDIRVKELQITVSVTNTGKCAGKETVQVYLSCPQGRLKKEYRRLAAFAKTPLLAPGECTELALEVPAKQLASYDEQASAWIIEAGTYGIWIGNSLETAVLAAAWDVERDVILERTAHICPLQEQLPVLTPPEVPQSDTSGIVHVHLPEDLLCVACPAAPLPSKAAVELAERLPARDLIPLLMGEISRGQGALGAAGIRVPGSAGETSSAYLESLGLAAAVMADGPAGLRLTQAYEVDPETGTVYDPGFLASIERGLFAQPEIHPGTETWHQFCTAFPAGTLLAQSFDPALLEEVGRAAAEEMEEFHVAWWLAPGMNIHRNPLCGRNFEYYSEDPFLSGKLAAAITRGVQSLPGVGTTIKHFACNNQEDNRIGSDSIVSERALREIYLRGFEIAVKESQPMCIMTSYNLVNGVHAANNYDLCTTVARQEWGFQGVIMSDWTTTLPEAGSIPHLCVKAGNDLIMPGMESDLSEITAAYENGSLTDEDIRSCAARLIHVILQTNAYEDCRPYQA
ncbi:MAG TPA: beta-glucosidase [Lachnospiraceae bacterium]|nr:beta-glucosidase [Lachnospiraceae bacterium]